MKLKLIIWLIGFSCVFATGLHAQGLMDLLDETEEPVTEYTYATFKTTRIVSGQSIENPHSGVLLFVISHRFGRLNTGAYELWGLDQSTIRLGFEYGVNDRLALGLGRSSFEKTYDGSVKYKILRQSSGARVMPVTLSVFTGIYVNSLHWREPDRENYFSSRLSYAGQLLIARKFSNTLSLQLSPTMIHKNLVETERDPNDIYALGIGGRFRLSNRITFNAEYFHLFTRETARNFDSPILLGFDIETGGHVFQLHITNTQPFFERGFITETKSNLFEGDIYFGFNISRAFTIRKPKL